MRYLFPATLIVGALTASLALASEHKVATTYIVNGHAATAQRALAAALQDLQVLQCKPVVAVLSKGGNSIRLAPKKAK